ncbi:unnamed protein product [marine sediment metagenome]|uniref:Uncharacterized protein n=1 Tax=marine sediment metagenome TaxID=412755 RepID=X1MYQ7_9ZZZZ
MIFYTLFTFGIDDLATTTAYIGEVFTDMSVLIYLAIGLPLAFWVIRKVMRLFPGR